MLFHRVRESLGPWLIHAEAAVFAKTKVLCRRPMAYRPKPKLIGQFTLVL